jgi:putative hydrolase of the HAD superfamily
VTRLRGVLFDLDDTLADSAAADLRVWQDIVELIAERFPDVDRDQLRERYDAAVEGRYADFLVGKTDFVTFRRSRLGDALEPWGKVDDALFEAYMREKARIPDEVTPFPDAVAVLRALRAEGIRVGVLTNGPSDTQRRKLEVSGLEPELDAIAISGEIGVPKPDPEAFRKALALLHTRAEETAMVGDSLENDVLGALGAGLAAVVWMPRAHDGDLPPGAHLAREIAEVPRLLGLDI